MFPVLARAASLIASREPRAQFLVARAPRLDDSMFDPSPFGDSHPPLAIVNGRTDDVLAAGGEYPILRLRGPLDPGQFGSGR